MDLFENVDIDDVFVFLEQNKIIPKIKNINMTNTILSNYEKKILQKISTKN